jgi:hypothetical protein
MKVLVVHGDAAWLRCLGTDAIIRERTYVDETCIRLELTSKAVVTIVNGARGVFPKTDEGEQRMTLMPLFQEPQHDNQYAHLCTFLGYCRRPFALRSWLVPYCVCCWTAELADEKDAVVLPCKVIPPFHAICKRCASEKMTTQSHCPYANCLLRSIPLALLYEKRREEEEEEDEEHAKRRRVEEEEEEEEEDDE